MSLCHYNSCFFYPFFYLLSSILFSFSYSFPVLGSSFWQEITTFWFDYFPHHNSKYSILLTMKSPNQKKNNLDPDFVSLCLLFSKSQLITTFILQTIWIPIVIYVPALAFNQGTTENYVFFVAKSFEFFYLLFLQSLVSIFTLSRQWFALCVSFTPALVAWKRWFGQMWYRHLWCWAAWL